MADFLLQEDGASKIELEDSSGFLLLEAGSIDYGSAHIFPEIADPSDTVYDLRWVACYSDSGTVVEVIFWGDSTARRSFTGTERTDFLAAWTASRAANPQLPWGRPLTVGDATLTVGSVTYNLLMVDNWYDVGADQVAVRLFGSPSTWDFHSADGMEPPVLFDKTTFENAMNAFTLG